MTYNYFEMNKSMNIHMVNVFAISFFIQCLLETISLYALCRKNFRRKQFFTSEDATKVMVREKNSFDKIFFGEEQHNRDNISQFSQYQIPYLVLNFYLPVLK